MELIFEPIDYNLESLISRAELLPCDIERLDAIGSDKRRCEWLNSRVLVWERLGKRIGVRADGAPTVEGGYISISHCQSHIAIVVDERPVGIDIEHEQRNASKLSRKFTDKAELSIVESCYAQNPALLIWCAKEALYKLAGVEGAEFLTAFRIIKAMDDEVEAIVFGTSVRLRFFVREAILCVYTPEQSH